MKPRFTVKSTATVEGAWIIRDEHDRHVEVCSSRAKARARAAELNAEAAAAHVASFAEPERAHSVALNAQAGAHEPIVIKGDASPDAIARLQADTTPRVLVIAGDDHTMSDVNAFIAAAVKAAAVKAGRFSSFEASEHPGLFMRLMRDPAVETFELPLPWHGVRAKETP